MRYHAPLVPLHQIRTIAADIKIAHSVFALPFAVLAAFMAASFRDGEIRWGTFGGQLILILVAMVLARTAAMIANRLLDARFDAENPRTAGRAIPAGNLSPPQARIAWTVTALAFMICCGLFGVLYDNWWPSFLGLPVLGWISLYGLSKRFTQFCHLWLGSSLAMSPIAAAIAVDPASLESPGIWCLSAMVLFWVAGFDVIYALQDVEIDKQQGLHSMPSRLGVARSLVAARVMHVIAVLCLLGVAMSVPSLGRLMFVVSGAVAALLVFEHLTVSRWGTSRMALTFFTINGLVSCLIGIAGVVDLSIL